MAKKDSSPQQAAKPKKRRWYHNYSDAYTVVKRTYPWITVTLIALPIVLIGLGILAAVKGSSPIVMIILALSLAMLADMSLLAFLVRPAMYQQIDGKVGAAYAVIGQIKRGWVVDEEPIAANKNQDVVWRLVGRPGVVLVSEGPSSRVLPLLKNEQKRIQRAITNVPVTFVQMGNEEGQVPLKKLRSKLRSLPKKLTKHEVPEVANRLRALGNRSMSIPKGVDPYNTRSSRRALRG